MVALGGIILGPALAVGGFMMAGKAEEALTKATEYGAKVDVAVAEMKKVRLVLAALQANAMEMTSALNSMVDRFNWVKVDSDDDVVGFQRMVIVGKGLKSLLDIAVMEEDGSAATNIKARASGYLTA